MQPSRPKQLRSLLEYPRECQETDPEPRNNEVHHFGPCGRGWVEWPAIREDSCHKLDMVLGRLQRDRVAEEWCIVFRLPAEWINSREHIVTFPRIERADMKVFCPCFTELAIVRYCRWYDSRCFVTWSRRIATVAVF